MRRSLNLLAVVVLAAAGCGYRANPIPLRAGSDDLTAMQGEWAGSYTNTHSGQTGSISFSLEAGANVAYGEVVMRPRGANLPVNRALNTPDAHVAPVNTVPEIITISFARIENGQVSGKLDSYRDPACGCMVATTFTGRFRSPTVIEGTFVTAPVALRSTQTGTWRVTRVHR